MAYQPAPPPPISARSSGRRLPILWSSLAPSIRSQVENGIGVALRGEECRLTPYQIMPGAPEQQALEVISQVEQIAVLPGVLGVVIAFTDIAARELDLLASKNIPTVLIERTRPDNRLGAVSLDQAGGAREAALALIELGRTKIGYVGPCEGEGWTGGERFSGIRRLMEERGLPLAYEHAPNYDPEEAIEATSRLLQAQPDLNALIFASDVQAKAGLKAISEAGRRVPEDLAVVGFDDSTTARTSEPPLSSVRQPFEEAGYRSVRMILRHVADATPLENIVLKEQVILRASCLRGLTEDLIFESGKNMLASHVRA